MAGHEIACSTVGVGPLRALATKSSKTAGAGTGCGCPCKSGAICRAGKCQAAFCGPPFSDTLPACTGAGGTCAYTANTTCSGMGSPDACAYDDEFCCRP